MVHVVLQHLRAAAALPGLLNLLLCSLSFAELERNHGAWMLHGLMRAERV